MKEGWRNKRIDEITYLITDGDWIESRHQSDDGFRLIQTGNIGRGIFKSKDDKPHFISETTFKELSCTEIFEGDCLISRLPDPVGRSCLIPNIGNRMITAVDCTILRFKKEVIPSYFVYYTQSNRYSKEIEGNVTGATRKRISRKNLEKIQVPVPPLLEQQHIVEELDLLSSIIEKKKAQLNELDILAQSLFYEMFGDPIANENGWEVDMLENVVANDCTISYGIVQPGDDVLDGIPVVRPVDLVTIVVEREGLKRVAKDISDFYKRTILKGGEILLCVRGTTGIMSFASSNLAGCNVTRGITPLAFGDKLNKYYAFCYLKSKHIQDIIADNTRGATLKQINMKDVRQLPMLIPPIGLQNQFASKIEAIEHQKELIKQSIKEVETLFISRMDYYFN